MGKANFDLPDDKLEQVVRSSGAHSKREAIIIALDEFLKKKQREKLILSYGKHSLKWTQKSLKKYRG